MKKLFLLLGVITIFASCEKNQKDRDFDDVPSITNIDGTWVVVSYEIGKNRLIRKADVDSWDGMDVILTFTNDSLYGKNTTNTIMGKYALNNRSIQIINYGGTKIGQPEWGNMFSDVVFKLESYKINATQLRFYYDDNKSSMTLSRK